MDKLSGDFWHGRIARYVPLVLVAATVLFLSTNEASSVGTSRFIRPFLEYLFPTADESTLASYHGAIRKVAHLFEYAVLAIVAARAYRHSSKVYLHGFWSAASLATVLVVASADEFNQSLNPLRTGSAFDVAIDVAGGLIGVIAVTLAIRFFGMGSKAGAGST
ncbi:MAG: VanZ family protein [Acidobacteriota bacterium]|nr:VanZ family protein [Acidobacteriota bacterium]MDH3529280.1 VanZ family protein [Acidobacteriota bacterium]